MLRFHPSRDVRRKEGGQGRRREREGVISNCKYSKKIDEVNTIRGYYLVYLCK